MDRSLEPDVPAGALARHAEAAFLKARSHLADLSDLETRLGYSFADQAHLLLALTHVGAASRRAESYQRLEFLGDRVLGVVVAAMLYAQFPEADEGDLSRRLAELVRKESCAAVAARWQVESHLRLATGEKGNAALKRAILADVCEAIFGAVFVDGGYEAAAALVRRAFEAQMLVPMHPLRSPKTRLQEWAQARGLPTPVYIERTRRGPDHSPEFTVAVGIEGHAEIEAKGASKRLAEQAAAAAFMAREGLNEDDS